MDTQKQQDLHSTGILCYLVLVRGLAGLTCGSQSRSQHLPSDLHVFKEILPKALRSEVLQSPMWTVSTVELGLAYLLLPK